MTYCHRCGKLAHRGDLVCVHCGAHLRRRSEKRNYGTLILRIIILIAIVLFLIYLFNQ